jgi:hypothetical protein
MKAARGSFFKNVSRGISFGNESVGCCVSGMPASMPSLYCCPRTMSETVSFELFL